MLTSTPGAGEKYNSLFLYNVIKAGLSLTQSFFASELRNRVRAKEDYALFP